MNTLLSFARLPHVSLAAQTHVVDARRHALCVEGLECAGRPGAACAMPDAFDAHQRLVRESSYVRPQPTLFRVC